MAEGVTPTKAERVALKWLDERVALGEIFPASYLANLYEERYEAEYGGKWPVTSRRAGAWNRTSGSTLMRMERRGFVAQAGRRGFTAQFMLTDAGREAAHA